MKIDDMLEILTILRSIDRRGGFQDESEHVTAVRLNIIEILDKHGICNHDPVICGDLAIVHDIREIKLSNDTVKHIESMCSPELLEGLDILSRKEGESSHDHFLRVLDSGNVNVLVVKWADCMANSVYTDAEKEWHNREFKYDYSLDQKKYIDRANIIINRLKNM